ncbi:MAG TPA: helix-turn-helix domain-containing protein [Rhodothermales bacterium]
MNTKRNSLSQRRLAILRTIEEAGKALHLREIVERTGIGYNNARSALSEMTALNMLARVNRGVYDLPERVVRMEDSPDSHPFHKILLNQQILKVLLNIVITNKALMETLLLGQQEIIQTIRTLTPDSQEGQEAVESLEKKFADRVAWHFDIAAQQVVEQYTRLPAEVLDVLMAPLARDGEIPPEPAATPVRRRSPRRRSQTARN